MDFKRITKGKDSKTKQKKNRKKLVRMVAPVYTFDPKILPEGSAKLRWAGRGAGDLIAYGMRYSGKKKVLDVGGPSWIDLMYFWGSNKKLRWAGRGARSVLLGGGNELKKTVVRGARARTRGQNPLVKRYQRTFGQEILQEQMGY